MAFGGIVLLLADDSLAPCPFGDSGVTSAAWQRTGTFPPGFLFGVATAWHQVKGNDELSDWAVFEQRADVPKARQALNCHDTNTLAQDLDLAQSLGINCYLFSIASGFLTVQDVGSWITAFTIRGDSNVGMATPDPQFPLDLVGMTRTCVLQIKGGCDIAGLFEMPDTEIPRGSLVIVHEENARDPKVARQEYDTRVAAIVSGANGVNPGISLYQEGVMDRGQDLALSGRVYALEEDAYGAPKPGDLLTSSATPGHVRQFIDHAHAQGAIVGKAMSSLKDGKGMVLVLVTLQ
jgi:hypothetical protein